MNVQTRSSVPAPRGGRLFPWLALTAVFLVLAWRQHRFVDRFSVNVMFCDQWDFYRPMQRPSVWRLFNYQHGLHRQGVGYLLTWPIAAWTHWNSRGDSFGVSFVLMAACALGLALALRCGVRSPLALAAVPCLFLTRRQWESFVAASNISCGSMPLLLLMAYCLAWFVRSHPLRLAALSGLTFCLIFTGYGFFVGLTAPALLAVEGVQALRAHQRGRAAMVGLALASVGASWWLFSRDYVFTPGVPAFVFPWGQPIQYLCFIGAMLANFYGVVGQNKVEVLFGLAVAGVLAAQCVASGWRLARRGILNERASAAVFTLTSFALLYCVLTAVGRVMLGWQAQALTSRYVTLLIPAGLAILIAVSNLSSGRPRTTATALYVAFVAIGSVWLPAGDWSQIQDFHDRRLAWRTCFLETRDERLANVRSGFLVYPGLHVIDDRLRYCETNHLNLFYPPPQSSAGSPASHN